jgi:hypothetical protein
LRLLPIRQVLPVDAQFFFSALLNFEWVTWHEG